MRGAMSRSTLQWMDSQGPRAETRVQLVRECVTWVGVASNAADKIEVNSKRGDDDDLISPGHCKPEEV